MRKCTSCIYAETDYMDMFGGGFLGICGCMIKETTQIPEQEWDIEWGEAKECPYHKERRSKDDLACV